MSSGATTLHDLRCSHRNENVAELAIEITNTIINPRRRHEIVVVPVVPPELSARGKAVASVLVTSWQTHMLYASPYPSRWFRQNCRRGGRWSHQYSSFLADPHALRVTVSIAVGMSDENSKPTTQCKLSVKLSADAKVRGSNLDPIACLNYLSTEKHPPTTSDNVSYVRLTLSRCLGIRRF